MSRLMSAAFTEQAVVERRKTVTRRKGWWTDKNGRRHGASWRASSRFLKVKRRRNS